MSNKKSWCVLWSEKYGILHNNKHDTLLLDKVISSINTKLHIQQETSITQTKRKWATFTYVGRQIKFMTKLFKNTNKNIAYKRNNATRKVLTYSKTNNTTMTSDKFNKSGIYQLTCIDCNKKYIGQTGRPYHVRYHKHLEISNMVILVQNLHSTLLRIGIPSAP